MPNTIHNAEVNTKHFHISCY